MRIVVSTEARANLERVAREGVYSHAQLSRVIGRGEGYVGRHIREGVPALLAEQDAKTLAAFTGSDPRLFGVVGHQPPRRERSYRADPHWYRKPLPSGAAVVRDGRR